MSDSRVSQNYKEKLDMPQIVFKQIDRSNHAASYDFDNSVRQKINNLPMSWANWVKVEQCDRYTIIETEYEFMTFSGIELGSINDPLLDDESKPVRRLLGEIDWGDPNIAGAIDVGEEDQIFESVLFDESTPVKRYPSEEIDWSDPNILSPILKQVDYIDYSEMDAVIMEAYEYAGLTWNQEKETVKIDTIMPELSKKPTPLLESDIDE